ncbi:hypothetical protein A9Q99_24700 [Gammaproteobacteria bacterium 45_16_T64]|nr:hypothetical protein A9Q99_24700 [Gammaproteobacteria bacterium 45_16_T64]
MALCRVNIDRWGRLAISILAWLLFSITSAHALDSRDERLEALEAKINMLNQRQIASSELLEELANRVEITGYVSLRGGQLSEDGYTSLGAIEDEWTFSSETTYGIQIEAPLAQNATVLLQFSGDSLESQAEVDWAFLEYEVFPGLTFRGGRLRVPGFMMSEYREVGYAYPWVQPPLEVYGVTPFLRYEGIDLRYFVSVGDIDLRVNPFIGSTRNQDLTVGKIKYAEQNSHFGGVDFQINYRDITARFSYSKYSFDIVKATWDDSMELLIEGQEVVPGVDVPGLHDVLDALANEAIPQVQAGIQTQIDDGFIDPTVGAGLIAAYSAEASSLLAQRATYVNDSLMGGSQDAEYFSLGISYDTEQWVMLAEVTSGGIGGAFPDARGGYATIGYRVGNWMPHLTYARIDATDEDEREPLNELEVNQALWTDPTLAQGLAGAEYLIELVNDTRLLSGPEQRSWIVGLRWDPIAGIAIKAEYQRIFLPGDSYGYILPKSIVDGSGDAVGGSGFQEKVDTATVVKLSLDLVF